MGNLCNQLAAGLTGGPFGYLTLSCTPDLCQTLPPDSRSKTNWLPFGEPGRKFLLPASLAPGWWFFHGGGRVDFMGVDMGVDFMVRLVLKSVTFGRYHVIFRKVIMVAGIHIKAIRSVVCQDWSHIASPSSEEAKWARWLARAKAGGIVLQHSVLSSCLDPSLGQLGQIDLTLWGLALRQMAYPRTARRSSGPAPFLPFKIPHDRWLSWALLK